ncbi:VOC family protein [Nakamurella sp. UYEF19]|uniref:VOC family protein n=1 Tax=Nakamurella sp. UYEF19 TaxID=1756392 RepID=UPI0033962984
MTLWSAVLDSRDPAALATFYEALLGWTRRAGGDETWVTSAPPGDTRPGLAFQLEDRHEPPVWPAADGQGQMQFHLDILVEDMPAAGAYALSLGATLAGFQPQQDCQVYLDPAGHPFCLFDS